MKVSQEANGPTDATHTPSHSNSSDFKDSDVYYATKILDLTDHPIAAAGLLDLDLYDLGTLDIGAGAGRDNLGLQWSQSKVHSLFVRNVVTSAGNLVIDQAALGSTAWSGGLGSNASIVLQPGACLALDFGLLGADVTDVTNHMLRLSAPSDDLIFDLNVTVS